MLEYILDGAASASSASSSIPLSWDYIQLKLEQFLRQDQGSTNSFDIICDWISVSISISF